MAEIVLALDLPSESEALALLDRLPRLRWVKIGPVLFVRGGPRLVAALVHRGLQVFLDLKWHDIPSTVGGAATAARELGVAMATVHTLGGEAMMAEAVRSAGDELAIVGVTVLTSQDATRFAETVGRSSIRLSDEVLRLAGLARRAGLAGVVCSPHEVVPIRAEWGPSGRIVVPGIRRPGDASSDQQRTAPPADAIRAGATHLVVGRPVWTAADPTAVLDELLEAAGCAS